MNAYVVSVLGASSPRRYVAFAPNEMGARKKVKEAGLFSSIPNESLKAVRSENLEKYGHKDGVFLITNPEGKSIVLNPVKQAKKNVSRMDFLSAVKNNTGPY